MSEKKKTHKHSTPKIKQITQQIVNNLFLHLVKTSLHCEQIPCRGSQGKRVDPDGRIWCSSQDISRTVFASQTSPRSMV